MNKRNLLYVALALLFVVAASYQVRFIQRRIAFLTHPESFALNQITTDKSRRITYLSKEAEAAGIKVGDTLESVEGKEYRGRGVVDDAHAGKRIGDPLRGWIRRGGDA